MADERRRVVVFAPGLHEVGGAARRSRLFAEGLVERGWEVRVVTRSATDHRPTVRRSTGMLTVELPGFGRRRLGALLYLVIAVPLGAVWCRRARGVLAVQLSSPAIAASLAALPWRAPLLAFTSTTGELSEVAAVQGSRLAPLRRWLLRRARYLVAQTDAAADELRALVPATRIAVVPTPVRSVDAPPLTGAPRAMYMGRFSVEKDLLRLVEAWRSVTSAVPHATLTLLGEGSAYRSVEPELRDLVAASPALEATVRFTGWVADPAEHLAATDVFVLPSTTEGMSNSLVEAVAWRRVVVASDIPANRAVLGDDYPLLFRVGDTESLALALQRALTETEVRAAALAALEGRARHFELDHVVDRLLELLGAGSSEPASAPG